MAAPRHADLFLSEISEYERMNAIQEKLLAGGTFARKQLFCKSTIIAWSHSSRFRLGQRLVTRYAGEKLLDYGCGDGTFLVLVHELFPNAVGADVSPKLIVDCRQRFAELEELHFVLTKELATPAHTGAYDVIVCMEVLEHCVTEDQDRVIADLRRLVTPHGMVLVSVPIEVGPSLVIKQLVRAVAGLRRLGDYRHREKYTFGELWKMVWAGNQTAIPRPVFYQESNPAQPHEFHGHKGFNWRVLRARLKKTFVVERTLFSPLGWLGGYLSSQVWFACRPW